MSERPRVMHPNEAEARAECDRLRKVNAELVEALHIALNKPAERTKALRVFMKYRHLLDSEDRS